MTSAMFTGSVAKMRCCRRGTLGGRLRRANNFVNRIVRTKDARKSASHVFKRCHDVQPTGSDDGGAERTTARSSTTIRAGAVYVERRVLTADGRRIDS